MQTERAGFSLNQFWHSLPRRLDGLRTATDDTPERNKPARYLHFRRFGRLGRLFASLFYVH